MPFISLLYYLRLRRKVHLITNLTISNLHYKNKKIDGVNYWSKIVKFES
jgi:hypothetical protein